MLGSLGFSLSSIGGRFEGREVWASCVPRTDDSKIFGVSLMPDLLRTMDEHWRCLLIRGQWRILEKAFDSVRYSSPLHKKVHLPLMNLSRDQQIKSLHLFSLLDRRKRTRLLTESLSKKKTTFELKYWEKRKGIDDDERRSNTVSSLDG